MSVQAFAALVATTCVGTTLLAAGSLHAIRPHALSAMICLEAPIALRQEACRRSALGWGLAEAVLGALLLMSIWIHSLRIPASIVASAVFAFYGSLLAVLAKRPGSTCACTSGYTPVNGASVGRALALCLVSILGANGVGSGHMVDDSVLLMALGLVAGAAFASLAWWMPDAVATTEEALLT
ncbi:MAG: hypothetical protein R3258_06345 [Acidimicrobiia bacterium]|nr:hypothetical protein [Acidimicrobiia bacterium]